MVQRSSQCRIAKTMPKRDTHRRGVTAGLSGRGGVRGSGRESEMERDRVLMPRLFTPSSVARISIESIAGARYPAVSAWPPDVEGKWREGQLRGQCVCMARRYTMACKCIGIHRKRMRKKKKRKEKKREKRILTVTSSMQRCTTRLLLLF